MRVILIHHAECFAAEENPRRILTPAGREQSDRLGARLRTLGLAPERILHSDKQWTIETAQRIGAKLGLENRVVQAAYPINTGDPLAPFMTEIAACKGDIMMCGHVDYLLRSAAKLVCGDEARSVVAFKPGNGTLVCIDGAGTDWVVTAMWRQDHAPG